MGQLVMLKDCSCLSTSGRLGCRNTSFFPKALRGSNTGTTSTEFVYVWSGCTDAAVGSCFGERLGSAVDPHPVQILVDIS